MEKRYHICGLGNALVDIEIDVTDDELKKLNIQKGMMTLIDETRLNELLTYFPEERRHKKACGGSAANSMIGATQFGANCFYQYKVAEDKLGVFYTEDLIQNKIAIHQKNTQQNEPTQPTGICIVLITPDAERTMNSFLGITATFSTSDLNQDAIQHAEYLYIEGYLAGSETGTKAAQKAKEIARASNTKTVLTFSDPSMTIYCKNNLKNMLGEEGVDILFCNETEALAFTETPTLDTAQKNLLKQAKMVVITQGKDGATIATESEIISIPGYPANAIDTNGAGDLFAGAFLAQLTQGKHLETCGKIACQAASILVAQYGPRLNKENLALVK